MLQIMRDNSRESCDIMKENILGIETVWFFR